MKRELSHPSRQSMIRAIETGEVGFRSHLEECESCRILSELLSEFHTDESIELVQSSPGLLKSIESIPGQIRRKRREEILKGFTAFDSWSNLALGQLRNAPAGLTRRLILQAGEISLELTAERHLDKWEFAAKVYESAKESANFMVKIGRRSVELGSSGFYYWTSKRPPAKIGLLGNNQIIEFEGLSW